MPKEILRQRNWNAGAFDEDLFGRDDIKVYFNGAAVIENCLCIPQGPLTRRPGLPFVDRFRFTLDAVALPGTLIVPNGGTASDAATANGTPLETATDMALIDPYVVLELDFGVPTRIDLVDLIDYGLHDTTGGGGGTPPVVPPFHYPWFDRLQGGVLP